MADPSRSRKPSLGLVDYSDSDEDEGKGEPSQASPSSLSLPPLPSKFFDLYTTAPRVTNNDDPAAHGGRHRAIPHVEGNWPTHIYFEWHLNSIEIAKVGRLLEIAKTAIVKYEQFHRDEQFTLESFLYSDLGTQLPLHISMSRPIVLRTEERDGFIKSLEKELDKTVVEPFEARFTTLEWVANQDRTRWFWVMRASSPVPIKQRQQLLSSILSTCNQVVRAHKQPALYLTDQKGNSRDGFHISIGWSLQEPTKELRDEISAGLASNKAELSDMTMRCDTLKTKIGNIVHAVELKRSF
ncbi:hypothetical protein ABW20_dc0109511 [Dactylellina cionopaga]|nr:hypothetical protein ABW20_dc0109511 [Dactylellina cionopaga]